MPDSDFYAILGVSKGASQSEIKKSYKKKAREFHPDRNKNNKQAEEQFKKISAAYAVLGDKEKRSLYDKYGIDGLRDGFNPKQWQGFPGGFGNMWTNGGGFDQSRDFGGFQGFGALEDIFENLFGGRSGGVHMGGARGRASANRAGARGKEPDVRSKLEIEFMDMVLGRELQIVVPVDGENRKLKVVVPRGVEDGQTIRLKGQGGRDRFNGRERDLYLDLRIKKDPVYERDGLDLELEQSITVGQAYNGGEIKIDTPWGAVKMTLPAGIQGTKRMRLKGKGIEKKNQQGDLYVKLFIRLPEKRNKELKNAVSAIEEYYKGE